jgi:hypothetical protein
VVSRAFEAEVALLPHDGVRVGRSVGDWKLVSSYFGDMGLFGKTGNGWQIMGHEFRIQKECRTWYEANRDLAKAELTGRLLADPRAVVRVEGDEG